MSAEQDSEWGRGYSLGIPIPTGRPLSAEEIDLLPDRSKIIVLWSGGNGPHEYALVQTASGPLAATADELDHQTWDWERTLTFVGDRRFHTKVWRLDP